MKTRIGVITYHNSTNYGAVLQMIALQLVLRRMDYEPEVINYCGKLPWLKNRTADKKVLTLMWNCLRHIFGYHIRKKRTKDFIKSNLTMSSRKYKTQTAIFKSPPKYDYYITGSDQVWNPYLIVDDKTYFLGFVPNSERKISYAASFGVNELPLWFKELVQTELNSFSHISVREQIGQKLALELIDKNIEIVLDPTLLLDSIQWSKLFTLKKGKKSILLCYYMPGNKEVTSYMKSIAIKIAKIKNLEIVNLGKKEYSILNPFENNQVTAGPIQFLNLFKVADFIITNSFHGTAFSVNFNKDFYSIIENNHTNSTSLGSRIKTLLDSVELSDRLLIANKVINPSLESVNFEIANKKLELLRNKSINFLKDSLIPN